MTKAEYEKYVKKAAGKFVNVSTDREFSERDDCDVCLRGNEPNYKDYDYELFMDIKVDRDDWPWLCTKHAREYGLVW